MNTLLDIWRANTFPSPDWNFFPDKKRTTAYFPSCEAHETPSAYQFRVDLPGINKEDIRVEVHPNSVQISGERKTERREGSTHFSEISYGSFVRSFTLPEAIDSEKVEANFENGVLNLTLSKVSAPKARRVAIK